MSEREQFEAWYLNSWGHTEDDHETLFEKDSTGSDYYRFGARLAHGAWQASREALKAGQPASDGFMCVPVADLYELLHKGGEAYSYTSSASDAVYWFKEGYTVREYVKLERLQEAFDQPVTDSWIACADRMPEIEDRVLVVTYGKYVSAARYTQWEGAKTARGRAPRFEDLRGIVYNVSHWMPLPSPPAINHPIDTTSQQYEALSKRESK